MTRALEKLRVLLVRRGFTLSGAGLATLLATQVVTAAPIGLAASASIAALAGAAATTGFTWSFLKLMATTKLQTTVITTLVVASAATTMLQYRALTKTQGENSALRRQIEELIPLQEENRRLSDLAAKSAGETLPQNQLRELLRLRGEVGLLRGQSNELAKLQSENRRLRSSPAAGNQNSEPEAPDQDYFPKESWTFVGYADPEAAFRSALWARSNGDLNVILTSLAPEERTRQEKRWEGQTESERLEAARSDMEKVRAIRILERNVVSETEVILTIDPEGLDEPPARAKMLRIDNEWKMAGFVDHEKELGVRGKRSGVRVQE